MIGQRHEFKEESVIMSPSLEARYASIPVPGDKCDGCTACCYATPVDHGDHQKPAFTLCEYQTKNGCSCYDSRPKGCICYGCDWMRGTFGDFSPEKIGAVSELAVLTGDWFKGEVKIRNIAILDNVLFQTHLLDLVKFLSLDDVLSMMDKVMTAAISGFPDRVNKMASAMSMNFELPPDTFGSYVMVTL